MSFLLPCLFKMLENIFATAKVIFLNKEMYVLGALCNATAIFFQLLAIIMLTQNYSLMSIIAMSIATFIGSYLMGFITKQYDLHHHH